MENFETLEKELKQLQKELRGVKVAELSNEDYKEYKRKGERVNNLMNKIYSMK